ncbi:helix-turn-helix domain-containing protein [Clostridium chromiireducens]|uniref:helix-turn-helix domain-containing protein n=1 Tax=Clostridium chromiireducens TaxID=225345 RepID=UPI003AF5824C
MNIGNNIKLLRKNKGLTQKQLADMINVSVVTIQNYENGRREPNMETLQKISNSLGVKLNDLLLEEIDSLVDSLQTNIQNINQNNSKYSNVLSSFEKAISSLNDVRTTKTTSEFQKELEKFLHQIDSTKSILENKLAIHDCLETFFYNDAIKNKFNFNFKKLSNDEFNEISQYMFLAIHIKLSEILNRKVDSKEGE